MHRLFVIIGLLGLFACGTQKEVIEESGSISQKDYPYIENFYKALRYKSNGRLDDAAKLLQKCLEVRQDDDAVYYALSKIELSRGNESASAEYIQKATALDPGNTWYTQELAYMFFETKQYDKAVEQFGKLVEKEPRNTDWLYGYAESLTQNGESGKAIEALDRTEDLTGPHPELTIQKYRLYLRSGQEEKGEAELLEGLKSFPQEPMIIASLVDYYFKHDQEAKAKEMLQNLVEADPSNGRAHLTLADVYRSEGKMSEAYKELKLAFGSDDVDLDTKMNVLLTIYESNSNPEPAVYELIDELKEKYPDQAKPYSIKGDFYLQKGDSEVALEAYKEALNYEKTQYPIWNQVLFMEYQAGMNEELYQDSKECLEYFPTISTVYLLNGVSANQLKKYDEAIDVLSTGIELIVNDEPMKAEFEGQIGDAYFGLRSFEKAKETYRSAIKRSPQSNLLKNNFAYKLAVNKLDLELAESLIKQVLKNSDQAQYYDTYGVVLFHKGEFEKAEKQFNTAHEKTPQDALVLEHLGDVSYKLGNTESAMKFWEKAKELGRVNDVLEKKINSGKYYEE